MTCGVAAPDKERRLLNGTIRFPSGLLGFPGVVEYSLAEGPGAGLFWLTGASAGEPSFLLADPFFYFEGWTLDLAPEQAALIEAREPGEVAVLAIAVPKAEPDDWTANLQGPVVINVTRGLGAQLVLSDHSLGVRRPFRPSTLSAA